MDKIMPYVLAPNYGASKDGIIHYLGKDKTTWIPMKSQFDAWGYPTVGITFPDKKRKRIKVSRLVLICWTGQIPDRKTHCAHLDGVKTNNRLDNLKWCSQSENESHKRLHGLDTSKLARHANNHWNTKLTQEQAVEIFKLRHNGVPASKIAQQYGINRNTVYDICCRKSWGHIDFEQYTKGE